MGTRWSHCLPRADARRTTLSSTCASCRTLIVHLLRNFAVVNLDEQPRTANGARRGPLKSNICMIVNIYSLYAYPYQRMPTNTLTTVAAAVGCDMTANSRVVDQSLQLVRAMGLEPVTPQRSPPVDAAASLGRSSPPNRPNSARCTAPERGSGTAARCKM